MCVCVCRFFFRMVSCTGLVSLWKFLRKTNKKHFKIQEVKPEMLHFAVTVFPKLPPKLPSLQVAVATKCLICAVIWSTLQQQKHKFISERWSTPMNSVCPVVSDNISAGRMTYIHSVSHLSSAGSSFDIHICSDCSPCPHTCVHILHSTQSRSSQLKRTRNTIKKNMVRIEAQQLWYPVT